MTDRLFVPASFVGLLADMPTKTASSAARKAWLSSARGALVTAASSSHGLEALRLATALSRELAAVTGSTS
jgi:hypothetical protein